MSTGLLRLALVVTRRSLPPRGRPSFMAFDALLTRYPGRRGTRAIERALDNHRKNGETRTRSELERKLLALLDAHGLPGRGSTARATMASSTPGGPSSASSSSATASPPTAPARP